MKFTLRGASSAAILVGLAGSFPAWAQDVQTVSQPPVEAEDDSRDRVIVTGSFIQGTPLDAALPVEVFTQEDLEQQGAPTALEFAKSLSISGPTTGEAYYFSGAQLTGSVNYNLRGLGADKTLTLLNGRRMSQNTANIPSAAIARTEILKDGAAVIYGADATGGVVNFITRDDFVGLEVGAQYKYIDGSDGDYGVSILGGIGDGDVNFMWSAEYEHRSRLETEERDFALQPYAVNSAPWSPLTNVASWLPRQARPANYVRGPLGTAQDREFGAAAAGLLRDFTNASCEAVGGIYNPNGVATGIPACMYNYISYYNLVEENDIYRGYAQLNATVNENMDFHFDASYGQVMSPQVFGSPAQPVIRGPGISTGATYQFWAPATNPYVGQFLDSQVGRLTSTGAPYAAFNRAITQGVSALTYRAFAHGGNPYMGGGNGNGVPSKIDNQIWRVSTGIEGNLGDWAGMAKDVGYNLGVTYNQSIAYADSPDVIGYRLQDALAGFGGPNCQLQDQNPNQFGIQNTSVGTSAAERAAQGCYYWNPFASAFPNQPELGLANPAYIPGNENRADVARWLFDDRATETINSNLTFDLVFNGLSGIQLPGGEVGWALGGQARQIEFRENVNSPLFNGNTPCDTPPGSTVGVGDPDGPDLDTLPDNVTIVPNIPRAITDPNFVGCTLDAGGPFVFFGTNIPDYADQQQTSFFGELQIPVLDNVNLQAAVRREEFSGGFSATVYKVSGKWDVFGPFSLRGSYGTNYQAPPAGLIPGEINNGVNSYTRTSGSWLGAQTVTRGDVVPETATAWNVGAIWQSEGFAPDHDLRIIVDYFDIETEDELGLLASANDIAAGVFRYGAAAAGLAAPGEATAFASQQGVTKSGSTAVNNGTAYADCLHPLVASGRVSFNGGACVQGVTQANALNSIRTDFGNGPGQHIAGFDVQVNYEMPIGAGDLTIGGSATQVTKDENSASIIDGFEIKPIDDRLGFLNFATVGDASAELRGNLFANYNIDVHNFRLSMNYVSGVDDERGPIILDGYLPGTTTPSSTAANPTMYGVIGEDWTTVDFTYQFEVTPDMRLTASVANILDKDPPASRQELGYDPRMGNPLGRTFEIGVKKTF
jgi:iron complex outermembrane receptor protein